MKHGTIYDLRLNDDGPTGNASVEITVTFATDKCVAFDLIAALTDEPYVKLLGADYEWAHNGRYA